MNSDKETSTIQHKSPSIPAFHHTASTQHSFSLHPHLNLSITVPHRWVRREPDSDLWQLQPQVAWIICLLVSAVSPAFLQSVLLQDAFTVEKSPVCFQTNKHFPDRLWWWHWQLVLIFESGPAGITFLLIFESAGTKSCQNPFNTFSRVFCKFNQDWPKWHRNKHCIYTEASVNLKQPKELCAINSYC